MYWMPEYILICFHIYLQIDVFIQARHISIVLFHNYFSPSGE